MIAQLIFNVRHQLINRIDNFAPVAGSKNYLYARFNFVTSDWDNINTKTAIFDTGTVKHPVILSDNTCLVPWEWLQEPGKKYVSVFGGDLITVNNAEVNIRASGYGQGEATQPPTPDAYTQVIQKLDTKADGIKISNGMVYLYAGMDVIFESEIDINITEIDGGTF